MRNLIKKDYSEDGFDGMGFWPGYTVGIAGRMELVISRGFHNAFFS
jgi:hypothetical protein